MNQRLHSTDFIGIIGATGNVGRKVIALLLQKGLSPERLLLFASERSHGTRLRLEGHEWTVQSLTPERLQKAAVCVFNTESDISQSWIPWALEQGAYVIDSSSLYRLDPNVPLIIPPVNAALITLEQRLYAHANCLASPIATALAPLHREYGLQRLVISTYQSTSGAGKAAMDECWTHTEKALKQESCAPQQFARPIAFNVIPQVGSLREDGHSQEEFKIIHEVQKVMGKDIAISATAVRVPVMVGHSISVAMAFTQPVSPEQVQHVLSQAPHVQLSPNHYSTPIEVVDSDDVWVGRIRQDYFSDRGIQLWLCSDNLRRGAATDAVEILMALLQKANAL